MTKESLIDSIVSSCDCIDSDSDYIALQEVIFKKDFGPWKKGEEVPYLTFKFDESRLQEEDEDGNAMGKSCKIELIAKE